MMGTELLRLFLPIWEEIKVAYFIYIFLSKLAFEQGWEVYFVTGESQLIAKLGNNQESNVVYENPFKHYHRNNQE